MKFAVSVSYVRVTVIGTPDTGMLKSVNDKLKLPSFRFWATFNVVSMVELSPPVLTADRRSTYVSFCSIVGSSVPRTPLLTCVVPVKKSVNVSLPSGASDSV